MEGLYRLKEMLCDELHEYGMKGEISAGALDVIDKLAHAAKNIEKLIMSEEESDGHSEYYPMGGYGSYENGGGSSYRGEYGGGNSRGGRMSYRGNSYGMHNGQSYARGRGRYAKRDALGRYSTDYSQASEDIISQLEDMKDVAKDERTRSEIQKLIDKMQQK